MTGKSEGAFRTIGEVAESLDLPQHVLRFWETRFSEIEPVKRAGGRRYYRPRDVELVAAIRHLLYGQGYTIKGVQRLLKEQGVRAVIESARAASGLRAGDAAPPDDEDQDELPLFTPDEAPDEHSEADDAALEDAALIEELAERETIAPSAGLEVFEVAGTGLVALTPRQPPTLTLPALRISDQPAFGLRREDVERLRNSLEDLAECKRLLELTRRWED